MPGSERAHSRQGMVRERMGADTVNVVPHSHYRTRDQKWIAIACTNDRIFERLAHVMQQPELAAADRFGNVLNRLADRDEVNRLVSEWIGSLTADEVLTACDAGQVPASLLYSVADIFEDPQYKARGNISIMPSRAGPLAVPNVIPKLSGTPGSIEWLGDELGAHNDEIIGGLLDIPADQLATWRKAGII